MCHLDTSEQHYHSVILDLIGDPVANFLVDRVHPGIKKELGSSSFYDACQLSSLVFRTWKFLKVTKVTKDLISG